MNIQSFVKLVSFVLILICYSCESKKESRLPQADSLTSHEMNIAPSTVKAMDTELKEEKKINQPLAEEKRSGRDDGNIEIKVFKNLDGNGFGYDIQVDGKTYVHQPNIPALPGNNGFKSESEAMRVAELVAGKIRNQILPPTVDVKELDSLGIH